jgi:hypothetical protein
VEDEELGKIKDDFKWAIMVGLGGLWRLHWGPIKVDLVYDFLLGIKNVNKIEIKAMLCGQKVKITHEVIFEMLQLPYKGLDIEWPSPTQLRITKMCTKLVDEMI